METCAEQETLAAGVFRGAYWATVGFKAVYWAAGGFRGAY